MKSKIKEVLTEIPVGVEEQINDNTEICFDIEDEYVLTTGMYFGRVAYANVFTAKNNNKYAKITIGIMRRHGDKQIIHEVERVYIADFHANSELVKLLGTLGCIDKRKCYIERVFNKKVEFIVEENPDASSNYKYLVTEITPVEEIPEEYDFKYVKTFNGIAYDYNPVLPNASVVSKPEAKIVNPPNANSNNFLFDNDEEVDFG